MLATTLVRLQVSTTYILYNKLTRSQFGLFRPVLLLLRPGSSIRLWRLALLRTSRTSLLACVHAYTDERNHAHHDGPEGSTI